MKLYTTTIVDENKYKQLGMVQGVSVTSINLFRQIIGDVRALFGKRQQHYEKKIIEARQQAIEEMTNNARELGATDIYGVTTETSEISSGNADGFIVFIAYGTAVVSKSESKSKSESRKTQKKVRN